VQNFVDGKLVEIEMNPQKIYSPFHPSHSVRGSLSSSNPQFLNTNISSPSFLLPSTHTHPESSSHSSSSSSSSSSPSSYYTSYPHPTWVQEESNRIENIAKEYGVILIDQLDKQKFFFFFIFCFISLRKYYEGKLNQEEKKKKEVLQDKEKEFYKSKDRIQSLEKANVSFFFFHSII
jgi:hypothetical protein